MRRKATWIEWLACIGLVLALIAVGQFVAAQSQPRFPYKGGGSSGPSNTSTTQSGNYTLTSSDFEVYESGNNKTITLPASPADGQTVEIRNSVATGSATPTRNWILANTGQTIEGFATGGGNSWYSLSGDYNVARFRYDGTANTWRIQNALQGAYNATTFSNANHTAVILLEPGADHTGSSSFPFGGGLELDDGPSGVEIPWPGLLFSVGPNNFQVIGAGWSSAHGIDDNKVGIRVGKSINGMGNGLYLGNTDLTGNTGVHLGNTTYGSNGPPVWIDGPTWVGASSKFSFLGYPPAERIGTALASAATIYPVSPITHVTGTTTITTIGASSAAGFLHDNTGGTSIGGCVKLVADGAWSTGTGGNIAVASTPTVGQILIECYDASDNGGNGVWHPVM